MRIAELPVWTTISRSRWTAPRLSPCLRDVAGREMQRISTASQLDPQNLAAETLAFLPATVPRPLPVIGARIDRQSVA